VKAGGFFYLASALSLIDVFELFAFFFLFFVLESFKLVRGINDLLINRRPDEYTRGVFFTLALAARTMQQKPQ
jgi:hypothetical protein